MDKKPLILDCDPGQDDAIALILASRLAGYELLGVSVVAGNQTLEKTSQNALKVLEVIGANVPVYVGASRPLVQENQCLAGEIHGESGLDGYPFPPLQRKPQRQPAVLWLIEALRSSPRPVTLVVTGPMTNLALALRLAADIGAAIRRVVFMGGCLSGGNVTPRAEFNIFADPEAAHIVFHSGMDLTMIGLDVTHQCLCLPEIIQRMRKLNTPASDLFTHLMTFYSETQKKVYGFPGAPLHDPLTIASLMNPSVIKTKELRGTVILEEGEFRGQTRFSTRGDDLDHRWPHLQVATEVDVPLFWDLIEEALKAE